MFLLPFVLVAVGVGALQERRPARRWQRRWRACASCRGPATGRCRTCGTCSAGSTNPRCAATPTTRCSRWSPAATWYSFRLALAGVRPRHWSLGVAAGGGDDPVPDRRARAVMPYLVLSQTMPLIALGPLIMSLGRQRQLATSCDRLLDRRASLLGVFLAFFPVAVGTLRGLQSPQPASLELMDCFAAGVAEHAVQAAVPGGGAVHRSGAAHRRRRRRSIGVVVSEISTRACRDGIGRLDPRVRSGGIERPGEVYTAVFGAAVLGLVDVGHRGGDRSPC